MRRSRILALAAGLTLGLTPTLVPTTGAAPSPSKPTTLAEGLVSPLRAAVAADGTAYVTQNFAGILSRVRPGRSPRTVFTVRQPGAEVGAVSVRGRWLTFATTPAEEMPPDVERRLTSPYRAAARAPGAPSAKVRIMRTDRTPGTGRVLADVGAFEAARNPDGSSTYGFRGLDEECAGMLPPFLLPYAGDTYSHPYATTRVGRRTYLADAGANDVLSISRSGRVRTLAVLPPVKVRMTADVHALLAEMGTPLPECVIGHTFAGEPVPTDIERGPRGRLFVSTLGGGIGEMLPVGAVHRIDPRTGKVRTVARGLAAPTGLAVADDGTLVVSELFRGRIVRVRDGRIRPIADAPFPAEVEMRGERLYATLDALAEGAQGRLVRLR